MHGVLKRKSAGEQLRKSGLFRTLRYGVQRGISQVAVEEEHPSAELCKRQRHVVRHRGLALAGGCAAHHERFPFTVTKLLVKPHGKRTEGFLVISVLRLADGQRTGILPAALFNRNGGQRSEIAHVTAALNVLPAHDGRLRIAVDKCDEQTYRSADDDALLCGSRPAPAVIRLLRNSGLVNDVHVSRSHDELRHLRIVSYDRLQHVVAKLRIPAFDGQRYHVRFRNGGNAYRRERVKPHVGLDKVAQYAARENVREGLCHLLRHGKVKGRDAGLVFVHGVDAEGRRCAVHGGIARPRAVAHERPAEQGKQQNEIPQPPQSP